MVSSDATSEILNPYNNDEDRAADSVDLNQGMDRNSLTRQLQSTQQNQSSSSQQSLQHSSMNNNSKADPLTSPPEPPRPAPPARFLYDFTIFLYQEQNRRSIIFEE